MVVDDDDLVSPRLTSFVAATPMAFGWYIRNGYVWSGGSLLYHHGDFSRLCGTSHIVRADLYRLPSNLETADETYIRRMLGSHVFLHDHLAEIGMPLAPLPFPGAVYRTGHIGAHSGSVGVFQSYILHRYLLRSPVELIRRVCRLQLKTKAIRRTFFDAV